MKWLMNMKNTKPTRRDIKAARLPIVREDPVPAFSEEPTRRLEPEEVEKIRKRDEEVGKMLHESEELCATASSRSMAVAKACGR